MWLVRSVLLMLSIMLTIGCDRITPVDKGKKIVSVKESSLYQSDIVGVLPANIPKEDSAKYVDTYIAQWVKSEILVQKAEANLPPSEKDFSKELEAYRRSMLIHRYYSRSLAEKFDTVVSNSTIEEYYRDNIDQFQLVEPIIKCSYIELPGDLELDKSFEADLISSKQEDILKMEGYCFQFAKRYDHFNEDWVRISKLNPLFRQNIYSAVSRRVAPYLISETDSLSRRYLVIRDVLKGDKNAPIRFVKEKIKEVILNTRRQNFIKSMDSGIFELSKENGDVIYYTE